jgi:hypothetical protein
MPGNRSTRLQRPNGLGIAAFGLDAVVLLGQAGAEAQSNASAATACLGAPVSAQ